MRSKSKGRRADAHVAATISASLSGYKFTKITIVGRGLGFLVEIARGKIP